MRIIGVLDLAGGLAVHALAGRREHYTPVQRVAATAIASGDAIALATAYRDRLGIDELYVADLDAITAGRPQERLVAALAGVAPLWLDAGVTSVEGAREVIASGATRTVIGLETLSSFDARARICSSIGGEHIAFSLDLREGRPVHRLGGIAPATTPVEIAVRAANAGASTIIVLDLARVGTGRGLDVDLIARLRDTVPDVSLVAGGGIRELEDVRLAAAAGCDGVLVATVLQNGRMTARDIAAARRFHSSASR